MISEKAFRKYDIRAVFQKDLPLEEIYSLARAICRFLSTKEKNLKSIAVGMDVRTHSKLIKERLCKAILDSGINVIFIGECATPTMYYATRCLDVQAGIMITASHNDKEYNGLKIVLNGDSVWDKDIEEIKSIYYEKNFYTDEKHQGIYTENLLLDNYINFLSSKFEHLKNISLNIIIDCGNGTAALILPKLIKKLNWQNTELLFANVDGNFPNHEPDPTKESNLKILSERVKDFNYGLALDGDCDRFVVMNNEGKLISGDQLLSLFAINLETQGNIVFDIKCSNNLSKILQTKGHTPNMCATGHAHIKEAMKHTKALLGGELSGHFCFADRYFGYDDAIYALLRFIEIYTAQNFNKELFNFWPQQFNTPELRIKCAINNPKDIIEFIQKDLENKNLNIKTIDGIRIETKTGWALVRASNTEPILSFRFEAENERELNDLKKIIYNSIIKLTKQNTDINITNHMPTFDIEDLKKELKLELY
jgi:phosphomannomutase / phosphoglucomutase